MMKTKIKNRQTTEGGKKDDGNDKIQTIIAQGSDLYRNGDLTGKFPPVSLVMAPLAKAINPPDIRY